MDHDVDLVFRVVLQLALEYAQKVTVKWLWHMFNVWMFMRCFRACGKERKNASKTSSRWDSSADWQANCTYRMEQAELATNRWSSIRSSFVFWTVCNLSSSSRVWLTPINCQLQLCRTAIAYNPIMLHEILMLSLRHTHTIRWDGNGYQQTFVQLVQSQKEGKGRAWVK